MKIETNDYMSVQGFARLKEVSVMTIYRWLKMGVVQGIEIDGIKFVKNEG
tara:strand:+ start:302 stop:451 length:150 start_codon:yes stop_codon:yes gene_type:complete